MNQPPPYEELLAGCGILLLARQDATHYQTAGKFPDWFQNFAPAGVVPDQKFQPAEIFPFLAYFLEDAEEFWARGEDGKLRSGFWTETAPDQSELNFEATAYEVGGDKYLIIRRLTTGFDRLHRVFQKGRELSLVHERLVTEIGKKEILLHCIIHDMSGPLTGMTSALEIAERENLSERSKRLIQFGLAAAERQSSLITNLLETFRAEVSPSEKTLPDADRAPDVIACASEVLATLQPAFETHSIEGQLASPPGVASLRVVAEKSRLERIFYNLLQNSMRFSPRHGRITVSFQVEDGFVRVAVEDEGPGVSPDVAPQLFQKFVRGNRGGGKAGLGLFFCRITVEHWGGTIGCEPRAGGGTAFWFRLKTV